MKIIYAFGKLTRLMNYLDMQGEQMKTIEGALDNILAKLDGK